MVKRVNLNEYREVVDSVTFDLYHCAIGGVVRSGGATVAFGE